jgi:tagaturonate reductase
MGCETVKEAFNAPRIEKFINTMVAEEVLPVIDEDPDELNKFSAKILERFYNPYIKHYLKDIALNSLSKWEARNFPTIKDNSEKLNNEAKRTAFSFAALLVLYSGQSEVAFIPNDTPEFVEFIQKSFDKDNVEGWVNGIVNNKKIWKENLSAIPSFVDNVINDVQLILQKRMNEALQLSNHEQLFQNQSVG